MNVPSWLTWARQEIGTTEVVGAKHEARVLEYWKLGRVELTVRDDETPWCAAFVNAALEVNGIPGTRSGRARSFEPGTAFVPCDQRLGAIVVLSSDRGPATGHVGILVGVGSGRLVLLGGNQGNRVCEAPFPAGKLVYLLWPRTAPAFHNYPKAPAVDAAGHVVSDG